VAFPSCIGVEVVAPESGVMDVHRLMRNPVTPINGVVASPETPGIGIDWDWAAIERWTR
jgi:L-alanine-DL-glutamate epimerase-like enolase superfamily enzyme